VWAGVEIGGQRILAYANSSSHERKPLKTSKDPAIPLRGVFFVIAPGFGASDATSPDDCYACAAVFGASEPRPGLAALIAAIPLLGIT
jgi:hypothetical protein